MGSTNGQVDLASQVPEKGFGAYAAKSLFQPHNTRQAIKDIRDKKTPPMLCVYYGLSSIPQARALAPIGFDAVWIDWEHSSCNTETMTTLVHDTMFMSGGKTIPWVRVPGHDHAAIGYALDCGGNIVVPQVETVEQAKHVVSAAKYGTKQNGTRSAPPFRLFPGITDMPYVEGGDLHQCLNNQAAVMIQIETLAGIQNLDAILTEVPDIDLVWLGTLDCRISMNLPGNGGMGGNDPEWLEAVELYNSTMKKHNKPKAGFAIGLEGVKKAMNDDFALIMYDADVMKLLGMVQTMHETREVVNTEFKSS